MSGCGEESYLEDPPAVWPATQIANFKFSTFAQVGQYACRVSVTTNDVDHGSTRGNSVHTSYI